MDPFRPIISQESCAVSRRIRCTRSPEITETQRHHIALLVEISLASGRDILRAIAKYVRTQTIWALCHEARDIDMDELARLAGLSRSALQRRFRAFMGCSVHQEVLRVRIQRARFLLTESELTLAEIAERTGFRHQEYLGYVFKTRLGKTPGEFWRAGNRHEAS
jgi:LacI family transcriptional regulator